MSPKRMAKRMVAMEGVTRYEHELCRLLFKAIVVVLQYRRDLMMWVVCLPSLFGSR